MRATVFALLLAVTPSCSVYSNIRDGAKRLNELTEKLDVRVDSLNRVVDSAIAGVEKGIAAGVKQLEPILEKLKEGKQVIAKADKDGDGRVSGVSEWWALLGGAALLILRNMMSDKRKAKLEQEVEVLKRTTPTVKRPELDAAA